MKSFMNKRGGLRGILTVTVSGVSPERFFNLCTFHGICFSGIQKKQDGLSFQMQPCDFCRARRLARKAQVRLKIAEKKGLPFWIRRSRKRLAFFAGILLCTAFLYGSSLYIWDIRLEGNTKYTDSILLNYLESLGYVHGMPKAGIVCEEIEKEIRNQYHDITWVSAEITGTRLIIQVRENSVMEETAPDGNEVNTGDITAEKAGVIVSMVTRTGTPAVHVGDEVEAGQLLISGTVTVYDESGSEISSSQVQADGDVFAEISYGYEDSFPMTFSEKHYTGKETSRHYLWFFGKRLYLPGRKGEYPASDQIDSYSQIHVWGNFYLPLGFGTVTVREYQDTQAVYSEEAAEAQAEARFLLYCGQLEAAGAQIEDASFQAECDTDVCRATGTILAVEEISRR